MASRRLKSTYEQWLQQEGIPVVEGYAVEDVGSLPLAPWLRLGGFGAAIQLVGMEGLTGVYVLELPPGGTAVPEKHMYDELMYIISGQGETQVWGPREEGPAHNAQMFEWEEGSLFAPPLNTWHRLANRSQDEPARILCVTSAPIVMDLFHDLSFVFDCDYEFIDRFDGAPDYFRPTEEREFFGSGWMWETNLIPDVRIAPLDKQAAKGHGAQVTWYQMSGSVLVGHMGEWQGRRYTKAHHHAGGQIVLFLSSHGYTLMWPPEAGTQPYRAGNADMVVRLDWQDGSLLCPPTGWFHQHLNTGPGSARQLALRYGSKKYGVGFKDVFDRAGVLVSVKQGGTQIEYEDEDPQIRADYQRELERFGVGETPSD